MNILVIYHQKSGNANQLPDLKQAFARANQAVTFQPLTKSLKQHVKEAVTRGCKIVVAAGGDGTVNAVAHVTIEYKQVALGVLPLGTFNHFAKDLHLPLRLDEAAQVILRGHTARVDIACAGNRYFLNNFSFGIYPQLVRMREAREKSVGKWPALLFAYLKLIPQLRRYHVLLTSDGMQNAYRTPFVLVSNNPYDIHAQNFTTRTSLTTGKLAVYILETTSFSELLRICWRATQGTLGKETAFTVLETQEITLKRQSGKKLLFAYDGEVMSFSRASITLKIFPKKLTVIVPR